MTAYSGVQGEGLAGATVGRPWGYLMDIKIQLIRPRRDWGMNAQEALWGQAPLISPGLDAARGWSQDISVPSSCQSVQLFVVDTFRFGVLISSKRKRKCSRLVLGLAEGEWSCKQWRLPAQGEAEALFLGEKMRKKQEGWGSAGQRHGICLKDFWET